MSSLSLPYALREGGAAHRALRIFRTLALLVVVYELPTWVEPFRLSQIAAACVYAVVIVGLNFLSGFGGQISLGHAAFFGLGAYTTGVLTTKYHLAPAASFAIGVAICFVVGAAVAFPALRLKGIYVALVTLAVGLIFPTLVSRFESLTGGSAGLFGVKYPTPQTTYFAGLNGSIRWNYWCAVTGLALACLVVRNLVRSRFGRAVIALRDNEAAAVVMGVNRTAVRTLTFGTSAGLAGFGGGLYAVATGVLTPVSFSLLLTLYLVAGMIIGGSSDLWGPIFGGFAIYFVPVWAADLSSVDSSTNLAGVFFGLIIILITMTLRTGVAGLLRAAARKIVVLAPRVPSTIRPVAEQRPPPRAPSAATPTTSTPGADPSPIDFDIAEHRGHLGTTNRI